MNNHIEANHSSYSFPSSNLSESSEDDKEIEQLISRGQQLQTQEKNPKVNLFSYGEPQVAGMPIRSSGESLLTRSNKRKAIGSELVTFSRNIRQNKSILISKPNPSKPFQPRELANDVEKLQIDSSKDLETLSSPTTSSKPRQQNSLKKPSKDHQKGE